MRPDDAVRAALMHALARFTVRYGEELRFAGSELPRPRRVRVPTRYGSVPVHLYEPYAEARRPRGAYVHLHGGAFLMRYPQMDDFWCRYLAATAGVVVANVDFRTGPYVRYPVAQHEAHDAAAHLATHGAEHGIDGSRVAVGGLSSGGGLAAAVCLQARDRATFRPVLQVLGVPALDMAAEVDASVPGMISPGLRRLVRRTYFPDVASRREPYASPLLADDLRGLPPAVVLTAERDTLRPDGDAYAARLREAGIDVLHDTTPGADHYFLTHDLDRARVTMAMVAEQVRRRTAAG
ncbi:MAG: alpha/beta hydrolase fold domain-containing protein [Nocardioides sp.]